MTQTQQNPRGEGGRRGRSVCEGAGRRNTNETGEKEKYWADVMLQMLNAQVHVRGSE